MGKQACVDLMAQDPATAGARLAQAAGVTEQEVPKALADNEWTDPCTGEPLDWDPAARAIVFTGQGRTRQGEYAIVY